MAKIINSVRNQSHDFNVHGSPVGCRGDAVEFSHEDIEELCRLEPDRLQNYLMNNIRPRLMSTKRLKLYSGK